jgi:hypothetical protein
MITTTAIPVYIVIGGLLFIILFVFIVAGAPQSRPGTNNKPDQPRPAFQQAQPISPPKSYPALRLISFLLRVFGWLAIGVGVCCFLVVLGLVGSNLNALITEGISSGFSPFFISIMTPTGIFFVMVGLWNLAIGEGLKVFVDIALNTEPLRTSAQDWSPFRPR